MSRRRCWSRFAECVSRPSLWLILSGGLAVTACAGAGPVGDQPPAPSATPTSITIAPVPVLTVGDSAQINVGVSGGSAAAPATLTDCRTANLSVAVATLR